MATTFAEALQNPADAIVTNVKWKGRQASENMAKATERIKADFTEYGRGYIHAALTQSAVLMSITVEEESQCAMNG